MNNSFLDRIFSILFYWTAGFFGLIYLILAYMTKKQISSFVLFNIYQSLFISILLYIISFVYSIFFNLVSVIPVVGKIVLAADNFLFRVPIVLDCTVMGGVLIVFGIYLAVCCLMYKKPYIPFVSQIVKENFGG